MKKLILLLSVFVLTFTSCNNNDDDSPPPPAVNPIVGTWTYHKSFENNVEQTLTDCEKQETLIFNADGNYMYTYYEVISGTCQLEESTSGTWTNEQNSMYTITVGNESSTEPVTFENNTFFIIDTETIQGETITYKEVYIKQ